MNRNELREIALIRLSEAKALFENGHYSGAYYLSGYAVECALKACIAKLTNRYDFPARQTTSDTCYTHDLLKLLKIARLEADDLYRAITNRRHGILPWIRRHW